MSFDHPRFLFALLFLVPLLAGSALHYRRRRIVLDLFPGALGPASGSLRRRYWLSSAAFFVFFACAVIALAGPRQGYILVPDYRRGTDVVLALDLSRSMDARDGGGPSRLERAAAIARTLVAGEPAALSAAAMPGARGGEPARYAAAIGKGSGVLALPLTTDTEAVLNFLEGISTAVITGRGTNLESLVNAAAGAFKSGFPGKRRIVLFSDGETLQGNLNAALDKAAAADIAIIALGLGSEAGAPVPNGGGAGGGGDDTNGRLPVTHREPAVLENAARRTGGRYIDAMRDDAARLLRESLERLGAAERRQGEAAFRRESRSVAHLFILAAVAAFALSKLPGLRRKNRGNR
jgi:Ca-activated chloride channel family protein